MKGGEELVDHILGAMDWFLALLHKIGFNGLFGAMLVLLLVIVGYAYHLIDKLREDVESLKPPKHK